MKSYGQENIKAVKSFYKAVSSRDFDHVRQALDSNVEWIEPSVPGLWFSGTHRGAEEVWKVVIEPTARQFDNFGIKMRHFHAVGDNVIAIGYFYGKGKTTRKELNAATAHVCTLRNGKIVRFEAFHNSASWLETLGLASPEPQRMAA